METVTKHRFYVKDLFGEGSEYRNADGTGVSRATFYREYLNRLNIKPLKEGVLTYVTSEQKSLLDEYHRHRLNGDAEAFLAELNGTVSTVSRQPETNLEPAQSAMSQSAMMLIETIANRLNPPQTDPLFAQEQLQRIVDRGWTVTTKQLKTILGTSPVQGSRGDFELLKVGKIGRQTAWKVERRS